MGAFDDLIPQSAGQPQSGVPVISDDNPFADLVPKRAATPTVPDEFGIGEEVRGFGRALNRGLRRLVTTADTEGLRRPAQLEDELVKAQSDLAQFDAEFPNANPMVNPTGYAWRQRQVGTIAGLEGERRRFTEMAPDLAESLTTQRGEIEALPYTQAQQDFQSAKGFRNSLQALIDNPVEIVGGAVAESAPSMALTMAGSAAGPAMPVVAGAVSQSMESAARVEAAMAKGGVDLKDPNQVLAWFRDRAKSSPEIAKADLAALGPATFDALTAGFAGRWLNRARGKGVLPVVGATGKEILAQAGGGGLGSVAGSVIAGEDIDWKDVAVEMLAEVLPGEAISNVAAERGRRASPSPIPRATTTPPISNQEAQPPPISRFFNEPEVVAETPPPPVTRTPEQRGRLAATGARILIRRGVNPDVANAFSNWFVDQSQHTAVGEGFRTDLNRSFQTGGFLDEGANTYSDEARLRAAAEANQFSEDEIQSGIQRRAERQAEIDRQNAETLERVTGRSVTPVPQPRSRAREMISRGDVVAPVEATPVAAALQPPALTPEPVTPATTPKVKDDDLQVAVQSRMQLGDRAMPGYVQVDSMVGGENQWSSNPTKLKAEGYDIPTQEELLKLPQGKYTLTEAKRRLAEIQANERAQPTPRTEEARTAETVVTETGVGGNPPVTPSNVATPAPPADAAASRTRDEVRATPAAPAATPVVASPVAATGPKATPERIRRINIQDEGVQVVFPDVAHTELFALPSRFSTLTKGKKTSAGEVTKAIQRAEKAFGLNGQAEVMRAARAYREQVVGMARTSIDSGATTFNAPPRQVNLGTTQAAEATPTTATQPETPVVPSPETAAVEASTQPAAANPDQKFRVGASPQTWTLVERLTPTASERANNEQPMRVRNDRTGSEEVVLESDLTPVRERTAEEKAAKPKRKTKAQLDKQLRDAGMDPSVFSNADEKRNALDRAADKIEEVQRRIRGNRSTLRMGVPAAILDQALEVARLILKGGGAVTRAIDAAVEYIRERMGAEFTQAMETEVRDFIPDQISQPPPVPPPPIPPQSEEPESGGSNPRQERHRFYGEDIGEIKAEIESVKEVSEALHDAGYVVEGPVTKEKTNRAWELYSEFSDPARRDQAAAELRSVVPQEMAGGIARSLLYRYALKMAAAGDPSLLKAMTENSNQFAIGSGTQFSSTFGRGLRSLGVGTSETFETEKKRIAAQRDEVRQKLKLSEKTGKKAVDDLADALNGVMPEEGPLETAVRKKKLPNGKTVGEAVDENATAVSTPNPAQEQADAIMDRMAREQSDTPSDYRPFSRNEVREAFRGFLSGDITESEFRATLESIKVRKETIDNLISVASKELDSRVAIERTKRREAVEKVAQAQRERASKTAAEILRRLEQDYAGVDWLRPNSEGRDKVREILREHYASKEPIVPIQGNTNRVIEALSAKFQGVAGVSTEIANQLASAAETKRQTDWTNARAKAIDRASRSRKLSGLIEEIQATPYLAQTDPEWVRTTAENWFLSNLPKSQLSREQARAAAEIFQAEFRAKLIEAQAALAERMMKRSAPEGVKELVDAIRAGLLDPSKQWADIYAEKAGWKVPTPEDFKRLATLELQLQDPDITPAQRAEASSKMMAIYNHLRLPKGLMSQIAANYVVTNLTGVPTATVNVFAPLAILLTDRTLATMARPQDAIQNVKALIEAVKDYPKRVKYSLTRDAYTFINNEYEQATNEMRRIYETGLEDIKSDKMATRAKGYTKIIYGSQHFLMRLFNALDNASAITVQEVYLANHASDAFRQAGLSSAQTKQLIEQVVTLKRAAYEEGIQNNLTPTEAQTNADGRVNQLMLQFFDENFSDNPEIEKAFREAAAAAEKDAYSTIGRLSGNLKEEDEGGIFSHLGYHQLLRLSARLRSGPGAQPILGVALLGYVAIPFRTARYISTFTPYQFVRIGINRWRNKRDLPQLWKQSMATEAQERYRAKIAMAGTATLAILTGLGLKALGRSSDDEAGDDEFGVYITGAGPKNKNLRDAWEKSGFRPNSINIFMGGKPTRIPLTRAGEPLAHFAWILSAADDYSWRKRETEAAGRKFEETWTAQTGHALGTYLGMMGQRGMIQNISQWARIGSGEGGTEKAVADVASRIAASSALPWLGMQRSILDIVQGRVDRSSVQATTAANMGIIGMPFQRQSVNRFGDQLGNRTWFGKIGNAGVPLAFQVADTDENQRFYRTLAQKGAAPSELRRYVLEDRFGPLSDDQFAEFAKRSGAILKQSVTRNLAAIEKMTPEAAKEYLTKATVQADRTAAAAMELKRGQPTARSESSAAPVPRAPAAALGVTRRASGGRARSLVRRPRGFAVRTPRARSSLSTMRTPRLRTSRARSLVTRPRRISARRARSSLSTRRRTRLPSLR